ncbi:MAG: alpha/beta hydrolase [Verrucomicrobiales bacterium]|nr:alpha/beta hydrolase [Verrucomicrobiales bacterium]
MKRISDVPYLESGHERQVLDIYTPDGAGAGNLPVMVWIHGGGWVSGDKTKVAMKPQVFTERGCLFVSINHRFLPEVVMSELVRDVASALAWVHWNIAEHGGDPQRIIVGGHSSGAQLAALICTDYTWLREAGVPSGIIKGCIPVDGDTYDIPKIILTAEMRQELYEGKLCTFGHRQKFENFPDRHTAFSAVTHVARGKEIPPFLILYFSGNPDTTAQAHRLEQVLEGAGIPVTVYGESDSNHERLNDELGKPGDAATGKLYRFLDSLSEG